MVRHGSITKAGKVRGTRIREGWIPKHRRGHPSPLRRNRARYTRFLHRRLQEARK